MYIHRYQYNRTSSAAGHLEVGSNPLRACEVMVELSNDGVVDSVHIGYAANYQPWWKEVVFHWFVTKGLGNLDLKRGGTDFTPLSMIFFLISAQKATICGKPSVESSGYSCGYCFVAVEVMRLVTLWICSVLAGADSLCLSDGIPASQRKDLTTEKGPMALSS